MSFSTIVAVARIWEKKQGTWLWNPFPRIFVPVLEKEGGIGDSLNATKMGNDQRKKVPVTFWALQRNPGGISKLRSQFPP